MPTLLRELIDEASKATNGEFPSQQTVPKATMIEPLFDDSPLIKTGYTSLENTNIIPEPQYGERKPRMRMPNNPPMDYQMNNQNNFSPNLNTAMLRDETRNISLERAQYMQRPDNTGMLTQPSIAGSVPPMKNVPSQPSLPMRIKERFSSRNGQTCIDTLNHISNCPMCSRYFQEDTKVYQVIIFMLIVLFVTILYFVCKDEHKFRK